MGATAQKIRSKTATKPTTTTTETQQQPQITSMYEQAQMMTTNRAMMNRTQSNLIVKSLVHATFGCVSFLRSLLPEENFEDVLLTRPPIPGEPPLSQTPASQMESLPASQGGAGGGKGTGTRVKHFKRGFSPEGDKVLGWLDGIMEAVEKQYLKTCVFAIYLDPNQPENLIETVTISFHYPLIPGTSIRVPEMTISDSLSTMAIGNTASLGNKTVGEVKAAIKKLTKNLIMVCQSLEELPAQKYGNMKLVYNDRAPDDYEAPNFVPLAPEKQDWRFATHTQEEGPERVYLGVVESGYTSMSVKIASIAKDIPPPRHVEEENAQPFGVEQPVSAVKSKRRREDEAEEQREDAIRRKFAWSADQDGEERELIEPDLADAEGEPDEDLTATQVQAMASNYRPYGIIGDDGTISRIPQAMLGEALGEVEAVSVESGNVPMDVDRETQEVSPTLKSNGENSRNIRQIDMEGPLLGMIEEETEAVLFGGQPDRMGTEHLETRALSIEMEDPVSSAPVPEVTVVEQVESIQVDIEAPVGKDDDTDSIASFSQLGKPEDAGQDGPANSSQVPSSQRRSPRKTRTEEADHPEMASQSRTTSRKSAKDRCVCGDVSEDSTMVACENCERWFHMPCTGHLESKHLPATYYCTVCILDLTGNTDRIETVEMFLPGIALLRRALWIGFTERAVPDEIKFAKRLGCGPQDAKKVVEKMINHGFLVPMLSEPKIKGKRATGWTFVNNITQSNKLRTWFTPGGTVERKEFGVDPKMVKAFRNWKGGPQPGLSAQTDSQQVYDIVKTAANGRKIATLPRLDEGVQINEPQTEPVRTSVQPPRAARGTRKGKKEEPQSKTADQMIIDEIEDDSPPTRVDPKVAVADDLPRNTKAGAGVCTGPRQNGKKSSKVFGLTTSELEDDPIDLRYPAPKPGLTTKSASGIRKDLDKVTGAPSTIPNIIVPEPTTTTAIPTEAHATETTTTKPTIPYPVASPRQSQRIRKERVSRARSAVDMGSIL